MSATIENTTRHPTSGSMSAGAEHMLVLVQGDMVISTFPEDQTEAAIDLARVLCRALAQPVDLFRVNCREVGCVQAGTGTQIAEAGWTHVAHLHFVFLKGVDVVMCEHEREDEAAEQLPLR